MGWVPADFTVWIKTLGKWYRIDGECFYIVLWQLGIITAKHLYIISDGTEKTWKSSKCVENMRQNENYTFSSEAYEGNMEVKSNFITGMKITLFNINL
jgi:hypothetical protein